MSGLQLMVVAEYVPTCMAVEAKTPCSLKNCLANRTMESGFGAGS
jgi:hypothetical protein